jgi:DNA mismatch repair protein MSH5
MFDLLNRTGSTLGQKMLESWFRAPLANIDMINERLNVVDALASPQNSRHFDELNRCCKNLPNVNQVLSSIQTGKPSLSPWVNLSLFLQRAVEIHATVSLMSKDDNYGDAQPFFLELTQCINVTYLLTLHSQISNIIDFESSRDWKRVYVRDGYNEELDAFKIKYNELEELLRHLAYELSLRHRQIPESALNMVYIPQLGYLISLTMDVDMGSHCIPETWDEIFRTTTNVYFKDPTTEEMDEEHGDIYQMILDLEIEILYGLQEHVTTFQRSLSRVSLLISELDAFSSLAQGALSLNLTRPVFCNDPILEIDQGRNIIVEQQVGSYIANNTTLTNEIAVITGANSSGKSAYLAQIGMISYLAHMGSFVPAKGCKIGIMDKILTKITSNESIMRNESFFYGDLIRVSKAIQMRSERSLVLMDEFGRGTDSVGGAALLGAIIEGLAGVSRCVVTTHFHELFKSGVLQAKVVHWHMDVLFTQKISNGVEELTYLFKLEPGVAENSFGIQYVFDTCCFVLFCLSCFHLLTVIDVLRFAAFLDMSSRGRIKLWNSRTGCEKRVIMMTGCGYRYVYSPDQNTKDTN